MSQIKLKPKRNRKLPRREVLDTEFMTPVNAHIMDDLLLIRTPSHHDRVILSELWKQDQPVHLSTSSHISIKKSANNKSIDDQVVNSQPKNFKELIKQKKKKSDENWQMDLSHITIIPPTKQDIPPPTKKAVVYIEQYTEDDKKESPLLKQQNDTLPDKIEDSVENTTNIKQHLDEKDEYDEIKENSGTDINQTELANDELAMDTEYDAKEFETTVQQEANKMIQDNKDKDNLSVNTNKVKDMCYLSENKEQDVVLDNKNNTDKLVQLLDNENKGGEDTSQLRENGNKDGKEISQLRENGNKDREDTSQLRENGNKDGEEISQLQENENKEKDQLLKKKSKDIEQAVIDHDSIMNTQEKDLKEVITDSGHTKQMNNILQEATHSDDDHSVIIESNYFETEQINDECITKLIPFNDALTKNVSQVFNEKSNEQISESTAIYEENSNCIEEKKLIKEMLLSSTLTNESLHNDDDTDLSVFDTDGSVHQFDLDTHNKEEASTIHHINSDTPSVIMNEDTKLLSPSNYSNFLTRVSNLANDDTRLSPDIINNNNQKKEEEEEEEEEEAILLFNCNDDKEEENKRYEEIFRLMSLPSLKRKASSDLIVFSRHKKKRKQKRLSLLKKTNALDWIINGKDTDKRKIGIGEFRRRQLKNKLEQPYIIKKRIKNCWLIE
ncbi:uncharacterized protein BX663DRAFT_546916 [Cokeromyces recurvatus]|uniref:uncharacterized protein n=1 Tax=Cokeromyces recurvatus TaxID=90255 RepID=UPI0022205F5D|nr:uncharacterized protein BX663DRAFT_546916 [Cokeromyces recurvatus]KAI7897769.1 hypothetical protein BX663DRAFT_546916 [Cokeromyces recurvatus]